MKKILLVLSLVALMAASVVMGTLAFTVKDKPAHNVITTGDVKIELLEWADPERKPGDEFKDVSGVVPGNDFTKIVEVKNTGSGDAWVRVKADVAVTAADGTTALDAAVITLDFNTEKWEYKATDGYWYYKEMLPAADDPDTADIRENVTAPLFTTVSFSPAMGNDYQGCKVEVNVSAMAVQYKNNGDTFDQAQGWPDAPTT